MTERRFWSINRRRSLQGPSAGGEVPPLSDRRGPSLVSTHVSQQKKKQQPQTKEKKQKKPTRV